MIIFDIFLYAFIGFIIERLRNGKKTSILTVLTATKVIYPQMSLNSMKFHEKIWTQKMEPYWQTLRRFTKLENRL